MTSYSVSDIDQALVGIGFTDREAKVYRACLVHGELTILEIARITGIKRTTLYGTLEHLVTRGALRFFQKAAHRVYEAQDPQVLRRDIERRSVAIKSQLEAFDENLPILSAPYHQADGKPAVSVFRGQRELQRISEQILVECPDELCYVTTPGTLEKVVGSDFMHTVINRRISNGMKMRAVYGDADLPHPIYGSDSNLLRQVRVAPKSLGTPTYTGVYKGTVFIVTSAVEAYGILIRSNDYAATVQNWFEVLWEASRPLGE